MSYYTSSSNTSSNIISSIQTRSSSADGLRSSDVVSEQTSDCFFYRNLWWDKGEFSEKAKWEEATLPYVLAKGIDIEDYERRAEIFSVHRCWEWSNGEVIIYELPSLPHEVCISAIVEEIMDACRNVKRTPAQIYGTGSTTTRDRNRGKEADASFRPEKPAVTAPNGSDGNDLPWPNLVIEVAYSETLNHVNEALKYWLTPGRAHDCIVVKIDPVPQNQVPVRMRAWHFCASDRSTSRFLYRKMFEFGTQDGTGAPLNIVQGQCIINISLRCLYHDLKPTVQIPQDLPDPIPLDLFFVQRAITAAFNIH